MLRFLTATVILISVKISHQFGYCYDQKCYNPETYSYFDCDLQFNSCENNRCIYGSSIDTNTEWCTSSEVCKHSDITGKAWCQHKGGESFIETYYSVIVGGVIGGLVLLGVIAACCCYCAGACCFARSRGSGGRVLAQPAQPAQPKQDQGYQMQVPHSPQPQYTGEAFLYQSNYPTQQGAYPPPQPAADQGYPPAATGYPPAATGYPPAATGYPPAAPGYPPAATGYPPAATGYPPAYPPTDTGNPPAYQMPPAPPSYQ